MKKSLATRLTTATAGTVAVAVLAACGGGEADQPAAQDGQTAGSNGAELDDWDAVVESANEEGMVRVYSIAVPAQNDPLVEAFEDAYPEISVDMVRGAAELTARVDAEISSGNTNGADVFIDAGQQWYLDNTENLLTADGPASEDWPDDAWAAPDVAPETSYVPSGFITWNTTTFPDGFSDWADLTTPEVRGQLALPEQIHLYSASFMQFLEDNQGEGYLPALAEQDPTFYASVVPMTQAVASGEVGVSILSAAPSVIDLVETGAPIDYVLPEQTWSTVYPVGALAHSARPNASRVFVDFMMTAEGQEAFNGGGHGGSPHPDIEGTTVDTAGMTVLDAEAFPPSMVEEWRGKYREIFGR